MRKNFNIEEYRIDEKRHTLNSRRCSETRGVKRHKTLADFGEPTYKRNHVSSEEM